MANPNEWWADDLAAAEAGNAPQVREQEADIGQKQASAASSQASAAETALDTETSRQVQPATVQEAFARARKAQLDVEGTERKAEKEARAERLGKVGGAQQADDVLQQLAKARSLLSRWSTSWGHALLKDIPGTEARALNSILGKDGPIAANNLLSRMQQLKDQSSTGGSGLGPLSNAEGQKLANSIASLDLGLTVDQVLDNINAIDRNYRRTLASYVYELDPEADDTALRFGYVPEADISAETPAPRVGGVDNESDVTRPAHRAGLNSVVARMVQSGRSAQEIKDYLNRVEPGLGDATTGLEWWEDYVRQPVDDPRAPRHTPSVDVETLRTEQSLPEQALGAIGDTGAGAAVIGAADFMSGGNLDALSDNPEGVNAVLRGSQIERPTAYAGGQMAGAIGQGLGIQGLAAKYGLRLGPATLSALQEGLYGYGTSENEGLAALGDAGGAAVVGGVAGKAGDLTMRGLARGARGATDLKARYLDSQGIPLTPGEILGGPLRKFESRAANWPGIGGTLSSRLDEGVEGFNRSAFREGLADLRTKYRDVKEIGVAGVRKARGKVSQAFRDTLSGVNLTPDDVFEREKQNALVSLAELDDVGNKVARALQDKLGDELAPGRTLTGEELQGVLRKIDGVSRQFSKNEMFESSIAPRLGDLENSVRGLVSRQAPDVLPAYDAARGAWRKVNVLGDAAGRSRKASRGQTGDDRGVFDPATLAEAGRRNAERFGGRGASTSRQYPFEELAETAEDVMVMPNRNYGPSMGIPLTVGTLGALGAHYLQPSQEVNPQTGEAVGEGRSPILSAATGLGLATLAGAPYSRLGRDSFQRLMMAPRSAGMERFGDLLTKYGPATGRGVGTGYGASLISDTLPETQPLAEPLQPLSLAPLTQQPDAASGEGYTIEIGGRRIPLGPGDWYDSKTNELVSKDGMRVSLDALGVM